MIESSEAYERNAQEFLNRRDKSLIGSQVVAQWGATLAERSSVIELACGGGYPITRALSKTDLRLWAIDSSPSLVQVFRSRFPHIPVQCSTVQDCDYFHRTYDAALAIGLVFLLSESDQIKLFSTVSGILNPRGRFLFTAPTETGAWKDMNTGIECVSLGKERYTELLAGAEFRINSTFYDKGKNNYYDVQRCGSLR